MQCEIIFETQCKTHIHSSNMQCQVFKLSNEVSEKLPSVYSLLPGHFLFHPLGRRNRLKALGFGEQHVWTSVKPKNYAAITVPLLILPIKRIM